MKLKWIWTDADFRDFPHLKDRELPLPMNPAQFETPQDMIWTIATLVYSSTGIVVTNDDCVRAHVPGLDIALKEVFG